jgi:hypothetical protein
MTFARQDDQRRFHRVGHDAWATLSLAGKAWTCTVQDLSLKGCLVRLDAPWQVAANETYQLSIHLTYAIRIDMAVQLSHQEGALVGLRCVAIDPDSIAQLKRLVELNLAAPDLLDREMHLLLGGGQGEVNTP